MNTLIKRFCDLVEIPSPSGRELEVGNFIKSCLLKEDMHAYFDDSGKLNNSNSGNLIVKLKGNPKLPTLLFVAHMDTVEMGEKQIRTKIKNGVIRSDSTTILGADNKASVSSLIEALIEINKWNSKPTIVVAFTTREEKGRMGSSLLNISEKIDYCFNLDGSNLPGNFVYQTLGEVPFKIKLFGKAAHAALEPEKGINSIKAAALLITKLHIGKDKKGNVLNIGKISGGKANNIVPDEVLLEGQVRAYRQKDLDKNLNDIEKMIKKVGIQTGCLYEFIISPEDGAPPASISQNHKIVRIAKEATKALELKFSLNKGSFTSDANFLISKYPTLTICAGGKMPHSPNESITVRELLQLKNLIIEIVKCSCNFTQRVSSMITKIA